jgi:hypothetical protein
VDEVVVEGRKVEYCLYWACVKDGPAPVDELKVTEGGGNGREPVAL